MNMIYMGLLDDRVRAYPWKNVKTSVQLYIDQLIQNIVIGRKPAINDGYIVNNPILRDSIFGPEHSFLAELFLTGEVLVPGRCKSFEELVDEQARAGVKTFREIPDTVHSRLKDVDAAISSSGGRIQGPDSMAVWKGFYELMRTVRGKSVAELGLSDELVGDYDLNLAFDEFFSLEAGEKPPSRTQWEAVLERLRDTPTDRGGLSYGSFTKQALMGLANEAYHYNFARQMSSLTSGAMGIQTALTPAFSSLLDRQQLDIDSGETRLPLITVPRVNTLGTREGVEKLLGSEGVGKARKNFIGQLNKFCDQQTITESSLAELQYAADTYNKWIDSDLTKPSRPAAFASAASFGFSVWLSKYGLCAALNWSIEQIFERTVTQLASQSEIQIDYVEQTMVASV